jgi:hypothetical protein
MKIRVLFLTVLLSLALCLPAMAEKKDFGKFKVLVPAGWTDTVDEETVILAAPDNSAVITISVAEHEGMSATDIAKEMSKALKGSTPERDADGDYTFTYKNENGAEGVGVVSVDGKNFVFITLTGEHADVDKILESVEDK